MFRSRFYGLAFLAAAFAGTPAYCTAVTYADLASWDAAATGIQTITFDGLVLTNGFTMYGSGLIGDPSLDGVSFLASSTADEILVTDTNNSGLSPLYWLSPGYNTGAAVNLYLPLATMHITLPSAITALSFNAFTAFPNASSLTITVNGTDTFTLPTSVPNSLAFFGITSDTAITSLDINGVSRGFIDNFGFGTATTTQQLPPDPTPEAATFVLIGSGLIGLAMWRKRAYRDKREGEVENLLTMPSMVSGLA